MDVSEATFEQDVLERSQELPVIVDFWAPWCGPCLQLGPVLEREIAAHEGKLLLVKVDTDQNPALAGRFGISGIPAVKAFRDGHVVAEFVGALPPQRVRDFLDGLAAPSPLERLVEELRESGEYPELLAALELGYREQALEQVVASVRAAPADERERLRLMALDIFAGLGNEHPLTTRYRRELATALY